MRVKQLIEPRAGATNTVWLTYLALGLAPLLASTALIVQEVLNGDISDLVLTIMTTLLFILVMICLVGLVSDIKRRKTLETELSHLAFHDSLTGLPNRALFHDRLENALRRAGRRSEPLVVVMIDMDGFKGINDSMGHHVGDAVLVEMARRIQASLRASDTCGRLGGDEFGILIEEADRAIAMKAVERLYEELLPPFVFEESELFLQASSGIAVAGGGEDNDALLRNADSAMYAAKERGDGICQVFEPEVHNRTLEELTLRSELRGASPIKSSSSSINPSLTSQPAGQWARRPSCDGLIQRWDWFLHNTSSRSPSERD